MGVHWNFIGALKWGERNPTLGSIEKVAAALGADPADMLRERSGGCETMQDRLVVEAVRQRFVEAGSPARVPLLKGGSLAAELSDDGVYGDNLGTAPFLPWVTFEAAVAETP